MSFYKLSVMNAVMNTTGVSERTIVMSKEARVKGEGKINIVAHL